MLSDIQIERYSRHIILPQVGGKGQERLLSARILVNGDDSWQETTLLYLAAAGVGTIGVLTESSSQFFSAFTGGRTNPIVSALTQLNPDCRVTLHPRSSSIEDLVAQHDIILSAPTPLHDLCFRYRRPFLCTAISSSEAWFFACRGYERDLPCLYCAPLPPFVSTSDPCYGYITAAFFGAQQATEAIKQSIGLSETSRGVLLRGSFPTVQFLQQPIEKNPRCSFCSSSSLR